MAGGCLGITSERTHHDSTRETFLISRAFQLGIVIVVLSPLILVACSQQPESRSLGDGQRMRPAYPVLSAPVIRQDLSRSITLSNPIEALRTIDLAARTDGVVISVSVEEGDMVSQGDTLAEIDVREQRAELARAKARLQERQANFDRFEQLKARDYVDQASYETAKAELAIAKGDVELWQTRVDFGMLKSTVSGTVVDRMVEPGEAVARHGAVFSVADLSSLVIRLGVSELDVGQLSVGQLVDVTVDAVDPDRVIQGAIRRIFPAADEASRLITVEIELKNEETMALRPGYLARVDLLVESYQDVLAIPAISIAQESDEAYVMVITEDMRLERRVVELGLSRGALREVTSGLEPGERVVPANPSEMSHGDLVRIVSWAEESS